MKHKLAFLMLFMLCTSMVQAQDYGARSINYCIMQMGGTPLGYAGKTKDGRLGAYQLDVNALFDAGACTGPAPTIRTTDWSLCNFRGLTAIDNFIQKPDDLLYNGDAQDIYVDLVIQKIIARNKDFWNNKRVRSLLRYDNSISVISGLMYRKGEKAVQLYALTKIDAIDKDGYTIKANLDNISSCGGGNVPAWKKRLYEDKGTQSPVNMNFKVPLDFAWKKMTQDIAQQIKAYQVKPLEVIDGFLAEKDFASLSYDTVDLNGDGKPGMQFSINDRDFCGTGGCMYVITDDGGKLSKVITTTKIRPAVNGVYINGIYSRF